MGQGGRILVVDDEPMVCEALAAALADEGYVVDVAASGAEAIERIRAAKPDSVLLDLMMPGMNGRQFLGWLRADSVYRTVPVVIMTAVQGLEMNLAAIGANDIVQKPFHNDEMLNKVALAVYRSRDADKVIQAPRTPAPLASERATADPGIVLVVERDRARLKRVDVLLSQRGYSVISMTRAGSQLSRLARAVKPAAVLIELEAEGAGESLAELNDGPVLLYTREAMAPLGAQGALAHATDAELVHFVERQR